MFSKICTLPYFYIISPLVSFWSPFSSPLPFPPSFPSFHKSYLQSKTFFNIRDVPGSAIFCSNAVLITSPTSSMQFFSFFDVLSNAPTTTGINFMLLMFQILLISLFSSWYLSIFSYTFSPTLMSPGLALSVMSHPTKSSILHFQ